MATPNIGSIAKRIALAVNKVRAQIQDESRGLDEATFESELNQLVNLIGEVAG